MFDKCEKDASCHPVIEMQFKVCIMGLIYLAFCIVHKVLTLLYHNCALSGLAA